MSSGLFKTDESIAVGSYWINLALDEDGTPHPMRRVRVESIDNTGIIRVVSGISGLGGMERYVSAETLRREYRADQEENDGR